MMVKTFLKGDTQKDFGYTKRSHEVASEVPLSFLRIVSANTLKFATEVNISRQLIENYH